MSLSENIKDNGRVGSVYFGFDGTGRAWQARRAIDSSSRSRPCTPAPSGSSPAPRRSNDRWAEAESPTVVELVAMMSAHRRMGEALRGRHPNDFV